MKVSLENYTKNPEISIAGAAAISHDVTIETLEEARDLNRRLIEWGHQSPFEFADATFLIEDISRSCLAQLTRHRLASYMVRSQRFCREGEEWPVIPDSWSNIEDRELNLSVDQCIEHCLYVYDQLVERGIPKEDARFILPIGTKTSLYMKANFREWKSVFKVRISDKAQWEIRELMEEVLKKLYGIAPSVFEEEYNEII